MHSFKRILSPITILWLAAPLAVVGQENAAAEKQLAPVTAVSVTGAPLQPPELIPDRLAGVRATGDVRQYEPENLDGLVAASAGIYREYLVVSAASRQYGSAQVKVFQTRTAFGAFGLFTFYANSGAGRPAMEIGSGSCLCPGAVVFWKDRYFVRIVRESDQIAPVQVKLAEAIAEKILPRSDVTSPPLMESLPREGLVDRTQRYALGPESLGAYLERGGEMFEFAGDAEAVVAEYEEPSGDAATLDDGDTEARPRGDAARPDRGRAKLASASVTGSVVGAARPRAKLAIVEYHTPHFATDAMARLRGYLGSLPEVEQEKAVFRREGNFVVLAAGFSNRDWAERLAGQVKYPYTVKWLRNPLWPTTDPFHGQKAAQMLLSTFGILGLILLTMLTFGSMLGAAVFVKRRKAQRAIFTDAGGMLRLNLDPVDAALLGLPPSRKEEC